MIRWISRIELKNFKSYRNQVFEFPKPSDGKNLILIGGVNGYGKTTLLEAIYVGLFGEEAVNHKSLDRAGLKAKSYGHFLETAFYKLSTQEGSDKMEVIIESSSEEGSALRITRKWFFNRNGKYNDQKIIVETYSPLSKSWKIQSDELLPSLLEKYLTPPWLAPFFFFDGEKIAVLADEDRCNWISDGLTSLLGVVLIKELRMQLSNYSMKKLRESGGSNEKKVDDLEKDINKKQQYLNSLIDEIADLVQKVDDLKNERDRCTDLLTGLAQGGDARTVSEVVEARSKAEQLEKETFERLKKLFTGPLPLQLIRKDLSNSLTMSLVAEEQFTAWEHGKKELQPRWEQFRKTFFQSDWLKVISMLPGAKESLEKTLEQAWDSLFNPRPENCASSIWHTYLQANERIKIPLMSNKLKLSKEEIRLAYEKYEDAKKEVWRLQQELIRLQGVDGESKTDQINELKDQLKSVLADLDCEGQNLGAKENEKRSLIADLNTLNPVYERERKKLVEGHPERLAAKEAEKVIVAIDDLLAPLFELKLKELSTATTNIFRKLHHKDQVKSIEIGSDGRPLLRSHQDSEINLPKSSGESQLFVLSLVGALAEVTGYRVPLIVDTPLARLSEVHCNNLLEYWINDAERQVILLVQDKEINGIDFKKLEKNVSKSYLLKHKQVKHGVGQSEAIENSFFGK